jgi:hypothetical protein
MNISSKNSRELSNEHGQSHADWCEQSEIPALSQVSASALHTKAELRVENAGRSSRTAPEALIILTDDW